MENQTANGQRIQHKQQQNSNSSIDVILLKCFQLPFCMLEGQRAQVSIEMIIVLAALVAIALLLVSQLQKTAEKGAQAIDKKADSIFKEIEEI